MNLRTKIAFVAVSASIMMVAATAHAETIVNNTELGVISPGTTTTDASGTRSTNPGPTTGGETHAFDKWQQENVRGNGVVGITTDYARNGNGSIFFSTDGSGPSKADMELYLSTPMLLSDFKGANYDWFRDSVSTIGSAPAPAFRLMLATSTGAYAGYGIFEPYLNGTVPLDTWTTETITTGDSLFWWNKPNVALPAACVNRQACMYTINQVSAVNEGLKVIGISTGVGSGWSPGTFRGAVDNVGFTFGEEHKAFNFEVAGGAVPEPATWAMMLVGFGGLGAALRSNRRRTFAAA